jgi:hypothetical protein
MNQQMKLDENERYFIMNNIKVGYNLQIPEHGPKTGLQIPLPKARDDKQDLQYFVFKPVQGREKIYL